MATYHVKANENKILAGTITKTGKWQNYSDVTEEAMAAVRDQLLYLTIKENKAVSYCWHYDNGKTIILKLVEKDTKDIQNESAGEE